MAKTASKSFLLVNLSQKLRFFSVWCIICTFPTDISSSSENINNMAHISRLSLLWLCFKVMTKIWKKYIEQLKVWEYHRKKALSNAFFYLDCSAVVTFLIKLTPAVVSSCGFCILFKNIYFIEHLRVTVSAFWRNNNPNNIKIFYIKNILNIYIYTYIYLYIKIFIEDTISRYINPRK